MPWRNGHNTPAASKLYPAWSSNLPRQDIWADSKAWDLSRFGSCWLQHGWFYFAVFSRKFGSKVSCFKVLKRYQTGLLWFSRQMVHTAGSLRQRTESFSWILTLTFGPGVSPAATRQCVGVSAGVVEGIGIKDDKIRCFSIFVWRILSNVGRNGLQVQWLQSPLTVTILAWFENVPSYYWTLYVCRFAHCLSTRLWTISLLHPFFVGLKFRICSFTWKNNEKHTDTTLEDWRKHNSGGCEKSTQRPRSKGPDQGFWGRTRSDTHMFGGFSPWVNYKAPWVHDARKWRGGSHWNWLDRQYPLYCVIEPSQVCKNWRVCICMNLKT